jgi:hypothetical protein
MKKSTVGLLIAAGAIVIVVMAAAMVWVGHTVVKSATPKPPTADERKLVVNAETLAEFGVTPNPKCDSIHRTGAFGTKQIQYERDCDTPDVYAQSLAQVNPSSLEARQSFVMLVATMKGGMRLAGRELNVEPHPELLTFGDQRYSAIIKYGNDPRGNMFVFRQGRVVHSLIITGIYFDDPKTVRDLLGPVIEESKKQYGPKDDKR